MDDQRPRPVELLFAIGFGIATFALLMPWPRPSQDLDACPLVEVGRFGFQCDLVEMAQRTGAAWLRGGIRVYEDGLRLREAASAGEAARIHTGSFYTSGRALTFSSLQGDDPRRNGHRYDVRSLHPLGPWDPEAPGRQAVAGAALAAGFALLGYARRARIRALLWPTGLAVFAACLVVQTTSVLTQSMVHVDSGYLLPAAEAAAAGARPYRTLLYNYTPLGLYEYAAWGRLWPGSTPPSYGFYLCLVLLNELGCSLLVFLILRRGGCAGDIAALAASCALSLMLWFDGARILQEPLYLLPILAAAWLALSPRASAALASGALAAGAMMVKQYGGFGLAGLVATVLLEPGARTRRAAAVAAGFALGAVLLALLMLALGVDPRGLLAQALGGSYPRRYETVWLKLFLRACPLALPALATPFLPGAWVRPGVRLATGFGLASLMPFYFRQHQYYFLNVVPWLFMLFALGVDVLSRRFPRGQALVHGVAVALLLSIPVRAAADQSALLPAELRSDQLRRARMMTDCWAPGQPTLMLLHPGFYAITHYRSADEARLGYRFPHELTAEQLRLGFQRVGGAWIDPRSMYARGADTVLREAGTSLPEQLELNGFEQRLVLEERFELWTKAPLYPARRPRRRGIAGDDG